MECHGRGRTAAMVSAKDRLNQHRRKQQLQKRRLPAAEPRTERLDVMGETDDLQEEDDRAWRMRKCTCKDGGACVPSFHIEIRPPNRQRAAESPAEAARPDPLPVNVASKPTIGTEEEA